MGGIYIDPGGIYLADRERAVTVIKSPRAAWESILPAVIEALGGAHQDFSPTALTALSSLGGPQEDKRAAAVGGVTIRMQVSLGVPIQVEATGSGGVTQRAKLPPRFAEAMSLLVATSGDDFFKGRSWLDRGVRYGSEEEGEEEEEEAGVDTVEKEQRKVLSVLAEEAAEIDIAYPIDRLTAIIAAAQETKTGHPRPLASPSVYPLAPGTSPLGVLSLSDVEQLIHEDARSSGEGGSSNAELQALAAFVETGNGAPGARRNAIAYLGNTGDRQGDVTQNLKRTLYCDFL